MTRIALFICLAAAAGSALGGSGPASAAMAPAPEQRGVDDPRAFVEQSYAAYARAPDAPPEEPRFAYSARLRALFDAYDAWQRRHDDLVGSLDFDWWTNSQDWGEINVIALREEPQGPDRRTIVARFRNFDVETTTRFLFVRENGRWFLDDAVQGSGGGGDGWTLSALLRERGE